MVREVTKNMQAAAGHALVVLGHEDGFGAVHEGANAAGSIRLHYDRFVFRLIANQHAFIVSQHDSVVRGGHEVEMFRLDAKLKRVWCYQSWADTWGGLHNGTFWFSFATLTRLLAEHGDATFPAVP